MLQIKILSSVGRQDCEILQFFRMGRFTAKKLLKTHQNCGITIVLI